MDDKPTIITLLRHGKPEGGDIFRGHIDVPLSDLGFEQMWQSVQKIDQPEQIISSPMLRCQVFAKQWAEKTSLSIDIDEAFKEVFFGDWDGQEIAKIQREQKAAFDGFWENPFLNGPPNGEPMADFAKRVSDGFWRVVDAHQGKHNVIVCHGGVIRVILADILQSAPEAVLRYDVPYAAISQIRIYHHGDKCFPQLVFHNP